MTAAPAFANPPAASLRPLARGETPPLPPAETAESIVAKAKLSGRVGFAVADVKSGQILEESASDLGLPPASVTKAVTALYALDALGEAHRFETKVVVTGQLANGIVTGDLVLAGGGDPTLDTDRLAEMAAALKAAGITGVKGGFKVY